MTSNCFSPRSVMLTRLTLAGCSAFSAKVVISSLNSMMSIFSPRRFADDRLHAHALHADTGAHRITSLSRDMTAILVRSPASRASRADHHRTVVNLGHFALEEVLYQLGRGAGNKSPAAPFAARSTRCSTTRTRSPTANCSSRDCSRSAYALPPCQGQKSHPAARDALPSR